MKWITIIAAFAAIAVVGGVTAATGPNDQGRRLAGPFCIDNATGVVHAVPRTRECDLNQTRKLGVAVPCATVTVNGVPTNPCKGPTGAPGQTGAQGAQGAQGAKGDTGATGAAGAAGKNGADGKDGVGCFLEEKPEYSSASEQDPWVNPLCVGPAGKEGPKGDKGDKGEKGATGGDGYRWICVHGKPLHNDVQTLSDEEDSNGGPLFDGGTDEKPDCKRGAKFAYKVVTSGAIVNFEEDKS